MPNTAESTMCRATPTKRGHPKRPSVCASWAQNDPADTVGQCPQTPPTRRAVGHAERGYGESADNATNNASDAAAHSSSFLLDRSSPI